MTTVTQNRLVSRHCVRPTSHVGFRSETKVEKMSYIISYEYSFVKQSFKIRLANLMIIHIVCTISNFFLFIYNTFDQIWQMKLWFNCINYNHLYMYVKTNIENSNALVDENDKCCLIICDKDFLSHILQIIKVAPIYHQLELPYYQILLAILACCRREDLFLHL